MPGLSVSTRKIMEVIADTVVPPEGPDSPGASDMGTVDRLIENMSRMKGIVGAIAALCWVWEFCPILSGKPARFSKLPFDERMGLLESWDSSRFMVKRYFVYLFKLVFMSAYYNDRDIWPYIGYEPGCLSEPPDRSSSD